MRSIRSTRVFARCGLTLGLLLLLAPQANAVVVARDITTESSLAEILFENNFQPSVLLKSGVEDTQLDPISNRLVSVQRTGVMDYSSTQPLSRSYNLDSFQAGGGLTGSVVSQAGNGTSSVALEVLSLDISPGPGPYNSFLTASSGEFELVRFVAPTDKRVEIQASYQLEGSATMDGLQIAQGTSFAAYGVFYLLDLETFLRNAVISAGFGYGETEIPLLEFSEPGEIFMPRTFNAWTNRDYFVASGAVARVDVRSGAQLGSGLRLEASATAAELSSLDADVSILRSTLGSTPVSVLEPRLEVMFGLGILGLWLCRRRVNQRSASPSEKAS